MRIALINPPSLFTYGRINSGHNCSFPIGLGYIASYVRQFDNQVAIFDPEASKTPLDQMWKQIHSFSPDLIGLTAVTPNFTFASQLASQAKKRLGCYVIMGGPHVTALPKSTLLKTSCLDAVIRGEGEIPVKEIAEQYNQKGKVEFQKIPGAAFLQNGNLHCNSRSELHNNLDALPFPARDLVDLSWYSLNPQFQRGKKSATVLSSRGCPSKCTYCANITMGRRFRSSSPEYFVRELETLVNQYGIQHFHIVDDCFTADLERVESICDLIIKKKLKITWFIFGRVDTLQNENIIKKLKQAGCIYILLGIESGNQKILDIMKKGTTLEMAKNCCIILRKHKITYFNSFIIGNEGDTEKTVIETINFAKHLKSVMVGFNLLMPFPGTSIFNRYYKDLDKVDMDWANFCSVGDDIPFTPRHTELSRKDLLRLTAQAYKSCYMNIGQLVRILVFINNPKVFLSYLHGAFVLSRQALSWKRKYV